MDYIKVPGEIEKGSFEIISKELGDKDITGLEGAVVKRIIHTTADFEYRDITLVHPDAIHAGIRAIKAGGSIYADTSMIMAGVNKKRLSSLGGEILNHVHDEDVAKKAKELGITRSMVALEKACTNSDIKIFAIGNAPTALFMLKKLIEEGKVKPDLIIGVPVGFVGAAESKDEIAKLDVPYIITKGRKGGSPVAAAIINALLYNA
ncbi:precorrin-8X methylmutase [Peptoclostridium litorale DSM 5388]|uniref:Precorrin-8X methylmutase CobH n=1 Tax=Peptoclostridium litorale DSM 5388 TaxID=1121324 RepID=A0A069RQQ7_PEPLI|nr:precorrin-8X methylmutase [Peptoclostridium litorale]KDR96512.1 precorrin-8X methylmutase CobH [Peptoclostridium litorale DSM 5388]SIN69730.1 precorrin-8X methylmutase [Peptoclostridium litorale DSM 5388]